MRRFLSSHDAWFLAMAFLTVVCSSPMAAFAQGGNCTAGQTATTTSGSMSSQTTASQTSGTQSASQLSSLISSLQQQLQSGTLAAAQQQRATRLLAALERVQSLNGTVNAAQVRQVNSLLTTTTPPAQRSLAAVPTQRLGAISGSNAQLSTRLAGGGINRSFQTAGGRGR